jgi:hypothetical protein
MEIETSDDDEDEESSKLDPFHVLFHYGNVYATTSGAQTNPGTWTRAKYTSFVST